MPNRAELVLRSNAVGFDASTISNDSKLEQKVLWLEKNSYPVTGTLPTTTLTLSGAAGDTETFTLGTQVYTMKTALTGVLASGTVTSTGTIPNDGDEVIVGDYRYVFKTALDTGAALYLALSGNSTKVEVLINASAANALTNLKKAINASGSFGTDYVNLTSVVANPKATAGTLTGTQLTVNNTFAGTSAYLGYVVTTAVNGTATTLSWASPATTGGVNPVAGEILIGAGATNSLDNIKDAINGTVVSGARDVTVSSATVRNSNVNASTKSSSTLLINATDTNAVGALATTETMANGAFTGATLASGVLGAIAIAGEGVGAGAAQVLGGVAGDRNTSL